MSLNTAIVLIVTCAMCAVGCSSNTSHSAAPAQNAPPEIELAAAPPTLRDDEHLVSDVRAALARDRALGRRRIVVQATSGVVNLSGQVASRSERARAAAVAAAVRGVATVQNQLRVVPTKPAKRAGARTVQVARAASAGGDSRPGVQRLSKANASRNRKVSRRTISRPLPRTSSPVRLSTAK